jgi:hypothetical protein
MEDKNNNGDGDCFEVAGKFILENPGLPATLVHAMVTGQGKISGIRFSHAWVEIGDVVFDYSNGRRIVVRKEQYYKLGKVKKVRGQYAAYDYDQAVEKMRKTLNYGPWDLDI